MLIFDEDTGRQMDIDISGSDKDLLARLDEGPANDSGSEAAKPGKRGRPKLDAVGREVTLLSRHWEWLDSQRGGASGTLKRLIDQATLKVSVRLVTSHNGVFKFPGPPLCLGNSRSAMNI